MCAARVLDRLGELARIGGLDDGRATLGEIAKNPFRRRGGIGLDFCIAGAQRL